MSIIGTALGFTLDPDILHKRSGMYLGELLTASLPVLSCIVHPSHHCFLAKLLRDLWRDGYYTI